MYSYISYKGILYYYMTKTNTYKLNIKKYHDLENYIYRFIKNHKYYDSIIDYFLDLQSNLDGCLNDLDFTYEKINENKSDSYIYITKEKLKKYTLESIMPNENEAIYYILKKAIDAYITLENTKLFKTLEVNSPINLYLKPQNNQEEILIELDFGNVKSLGIFTNPLIESNDMAIAIIEDGLIKQIFYFPTLTFIEGNIKDLENIYHILFRKNLIGIQKLELTL